MEFETGDIILVKGNDFFSNIIKKVTKSEYSHSAMVLNNDTIIESHFIGGVKKKPRGVLADKNFSVYKLKKGISNIEGKRKLMLKRADELEGYKYDLLQLFGYLIYGFKGRNKFNTPHQIICSELIDLIYYYAGINLRPNIYKGDLTPAQIAKSGLLTKIY